MKNNFYTLIAVVVSVLFVACGSMSATLKAHPIGLIDTAGVATLSYSGSATTMKIGLFKVNGKARSEYLEKTLPWLYNQIGSLGFSVQVPVGENTFEIFNTKKKEIVKITLNLEKKSYVCDFKEDYKVYELDESKNKKEIAVKVEKVELYNENKYDQTAILHVDKQDNTPLIFRINNLVPSPSDKSVFVINGNCAFNKGTSVFDIKIPEGLNTIEVGITGISGSGYSGQKYFIVHKLEFNAQKGKTYTIKVDKKEVEKQINVLSAHIEEN